MVRLKRRKTLTTRTCIYKGGQLKTVLTGVSCHLSFLILFPAYIPHPNPADILFLLWCVIFVCLFSFPRVLQLSQEHAQSHHKAGLAIRGHPVCWCLFLPLHEVWSQLHQPTVLLLQRRCSPSKSPVCLDQRKVKESAQPTVNLTMTAILLTSPCVVQVHGINSKTTTTPETTTTWPSVCPESNITFVSAFFDFGNHPKGGGRRTVEEYYPWSAAFGRVYAPLVFYTDSEKFGSHVQKLRAHMDPRLTHVISVNRCEKRFIVEMMKLTSIY